MTCHLQSRRLEPISSSVILSRLFAVFIALSFLFGPLAMDRAMAAVPAAGHAEMSDDAHCAPTDDGKDVKASSKPCCAAMCAASALPAQAPSDEVKFSRLLAVPAAVSFPRSVLSEMSTPPPRVA